MLGHAQQGGSPTPFDRNLGTKLAAVAVEQLIRQAKEAYDPESGMIKAIEPESATLLGLNVSLQFSKLQKTFTVLGLLLLQISL